MHYFSGSPGIVNEMNRLGAHSTSMGCYCRIAEKGSVISDGDREGCHQYLRSRLWRSRKMEHVRITWNRIPRDL